MRRSAAIGAVLPFEAAHKQIISTFAVERIMRTSTYAVLLSLMCILPVNSSAQVGPLRVTFSSPTAASLGKVADVPVNLSTGIPDVVVPLFTIKGKTIELPIALRYHGGGIRVEETGGWVGMGWALEAGGTVTRTVRGVVDESPGGYYNTGHTFYKPGKWPQPDSVTVDNILDKLIDGEPDQFFFNFAGRSGQFVMGPTDTLPTRRTIRTIPYQKLNVELPPAPPLDAGVAWNWKIRTEDGTLYTFAAKETTTEFGLAAPPAVPDNYGEAYTSSWHLTEIRAPGGDVINLYYSPVTTRHVRSPYNEKFNNISGDCAVPNLGYGFSNDQQFVIQRLDSIKSAQHTVIFSAPVLRQDALSPNSVPQEPQLTRMTVRTPTGYVIRVFDFTHDYVSGRLLLKSVQDKDANGIGLPPFTFTYDNQSFPSYDSNAQDHWGYWNGKFNSTLIPEWHSPIGYLSGGDRTPNETYMKVGSLTRITFPTGGYREFTWEANDYGGVGSTADQPYEFAPVEQASVNSSQIDGLRETIFTIGGTGSASVQVNVGLNPNGCGQSGPCVVCSGGECPWAEIQGPDTIRWWNSGMHTLSLPPGTYKLRAYSENSAGYASIMVDWRERIPVGKKLAGGLRVARIETGDGFGTATVNRYLYTLASDPTKSSGLVSAEPVRLQLSDPWLFVLLADITIESAARRRKLGRLS
jgi:hypothetical protein